MKFTAKEITLIALFVALITIGSKITIPSPLVPFTLQWFFVALAGMLLGPKLAPMSMTVYTILGLIGLPVFTKGGGISYVFSPTFGYLIGFILASYIIGKAVEFMGRDIRFKGVMVAMVVALFALYSLGASYMYLISNLYLGKAMMFSEAIWYGVILFLPTDLVSAIFCSLLSVRIARQVKGIVGN